MRRRYRDMRDPSPERARVAFMLVALVLILGIVDVLSGGDVRAALESDDACETCEPIDIGRELHLPILESGESGPKATRRIEFVLGRSAYGRAAQEQAVIEQIKQMRKDRTCLPIAVRPRRNYVGFVYAAEIYCR